MKNSPTQRHLDAFTLTEVMVATFVTTIIIAATVAGVTALRKSFAAVEDYSIAQGDQERILDFLNLDFRRATNVVRNPSGAASGTTNLIRVEMPTYSTNPVVTNGSVTYGTNSTTVLYFKQDDKIYRREQIGSATPVTVLVAQDVADFELEFPTNGTQYNFTVTSKVTFLSRFKAPNYDNASRQGTALYNYALLRNINYAQSNPLTNTNATNTP